jgi:hypothetical protein
MKQMEVLFMLDSAFCEILVKRKCDGSLFAKRLGFLFGCFIFALLWSLLIFLLSFSPAIIVLGVLLTAFFVFTSLKLTVIEYEYSVVNGTLYFAKIRGKTRRKEVFDIDIKRIDTLGDFTKDTQEKFKDDGLDIIYALPTSKVQDAKYVKFKDIGDTTHVFVFESNEEIEKKLKSHNPRLSFSAFKNL